MKHFCVVLFVIFLLQQLILICAEFQLVGEMARVTYKNPKYIGEFALVSKKKSRSSRYVTKMNVTLLGEWGNNVTGKFQIIDRASKKTVMSMEIKICDSLKIRFLATIIESNSDVPVNKCPVAAGSYHFNDLVVKLSELPFDLLTGDFMVTAGAFSTHTREKISEIVFRLPVKSTKLS